jgi:phosphoadenosine phosphosulfate reductase
MNQKLQRTLALLREAAETFEPVALASSFGVEDMVITDLIHRHDLAISIFTLDTGRLHEETHRLMQRVRERYRLAIAVFAPEPAALAAYLSAHGPDAIYESVALREECCRLRKVVPLKRALAGKRAWITGQRREQSLTRRALAFREHDAENGLEKFNPLADWSSDEVWTYIRTNEVPYNALYDQGYASIGCAPCTRPIAAGEDLRAGRWWWEDPNHRECGLHRRARAS